MNTTTTIDRPRACETSREKNDENGRDEAETCGLAWGKGSGLGDGGLVDTPGYLVEPFSVVVHVIFGRGEVVWGSRLSRKAFLLAAVVSPDGRRTGDGRARAH